MKDSQHNADVCSNISDIIIINYVPILQCTGTHTNINVGTPTLVILVLKEEPLQELYVYLYICIYMCIMNKSWLYSVSLVTL